MQQLLQYIIYIYTYCSCNMPCLFSILGVEFIREVVKTTSTTKSSSTRSINVTSKYCSMILLHVCAAIPFCFCSLDLHVRWKWVTYIIICLFDQGSKHLYWTFNPNHSPGHKNNQTECCTYAPTSIPPFRGTHAINHGIMMQR